MTKAEIVKSIALQTGMNPREVAIVAVTEGLAEAKWKAAKWNDNRLIIIEKQ